MTDQNSGIVEAKKSDYLIDMFATVKPGEPYRLFPFGVIVKRGVKREITPEYARRFRLPHFKPPIKLGSHDDSTPAGGFIVGLEVRDDGLYAIPEHTEKGAAILADGSYRYHSPEVIWEGGGLENPADGETIEGPLIVGDALLHTPHLGEAAALYNIEPVEARNMTDMVSVPNTLWDKFMAWFDRRTDETPPQVEPEKPKAEPDNFAAIVAERDEYKAKLETLEAESKAKARLEKFAAELAGKPVDQNAAILAGMTDEQAEWVIAQFGALSNQVQANDVLTQELGTSAEAEQLTLQTAIARKLEANPSMVYVQAFEAVRLENPDLFKF